MPRIRDVFANNLRNLLKKRGAITRLEERSGISRVQLNRYLNGTIPNEANLSTIAETLGVEEHLLFQSDMALGAKQVSKLTEMMVSSMRHAPPRDCLADTNHIDLFFQIPEQPDHAIRSVILLEAENDAIFFRRYTSFEEADAAKNPSLYNVHRGYVTISGSAYVMAGINMNAPHEPSILYLGGLGLGFSVSAGHAIVMSMRGPRQLKVIGERKTGFISESEAIARSGVVCGDAPLGDSTVGKFLGSAEVDLMMVA